ncbi:MAG: DUF2793 domain-containing protein [Rickettsiales bacterium]|nr:DUF2793 domain-containing protein [Rickettsiales bacterium]
MDKMEFTNNLKLPLLVPNQSGKEFTHNEALIIIDNLLHNGIKAVVNEPPTGPVVGDRYLVGKSSTGDFLDRENMIAFYDNGWRFIAPFPGQLLWNMALNKLCVFSETWNEAIVSTSNDEDSAFESNFNFVDPQNGDILIYDGEKFVNDGTLLTDVVDAGLSNITTDAKGLICQMSSPSDRSVEITAGSSGSSYVAPANGYVNIISKATADGAQGKLQNTNSWLTIQWSIPKTNHFFSGFMPCSAGDSVQYTYSYQNIIDLAFHYLNGN